MNSTLGAPSRARTGAGQAGVDSSAVRPITPGNAAPGSYSIIAIRTSPADRYRPPLARILRRGGGARITRHGWSLGFGRDLLDQRGQAGLVEQVGGPDGLVVGHVV